MEESNSLISLFQEGCWRKSLHPADWGHCQLAAISINWAFSPPCSPVAKDGSREAYTICGAIFKKRIQNYRYKIRYKPGCWSRMRKKNHHHKKRKWWEFEVFWDLFRNFTSNACIKMLSESNLASPQLEYNSQQFTGALHSESASEFTTPSSCPLYSQATQPTSSLKPLTGDFFPLTS